MNNDITVSTLNEVCLKENKSIISGPFGSNISSKFFVETGIPVIRGNNLTIGKEMFIDSGFVYITPEKANELNCYAIKDDLIFTAAGTLGQVGMIPSKTKFNKYVISNKQIRARINRNLVLPEYAYYWFSSPWIQKKLCNNNKGSTVPLLTLSEIKSLPIKYPQNLKKQEKVVKILSSIDVQIKRNNDMVQKLQVLTQGIFNKFYGRKIYSFNASMSEVCKFPSGYAFEPSYYRIDGNYQLVTIKNVNGIFVDNQKIDCLSKLPPKMKPFCYLKVGDILLSLTGNVGRISINTLNNALLNQRVAKFVCDEKYKAYLYILLNTNYYQEKLKQMASGTSQKNLSPNGIENLKIYVPDNINDFNMTTNEIFSQLCKINLLTSKLQEIKNKLLPLLINQQLS